MSYIPKIAITGTKGKTTTTYVIAEVLQQLKHNVLRVDTTGHYINGEQKSTLEDSKAIWGLVPTVAPGRYMYEFFAHPELKDNGVAVLEAALGSSSLSGIGYKAHSVGVFLNVFEDHLGSSPRIQSKSDIAVAKEFVFARLKRDGWAIFNADDELVVRSLRAVPKDLNVRLTPCGLTFEHFNKAKHLQAGGQVFTVIDNKVVLQGNDTAQQLVDLNAIPWTFQGTFQPSVWNMLMAVAATYAFYEGTWPAEVTAAFEGVRLQPNGGRLTLFKAKNGATILADYAHEKVSLALVAKLARTMLTEDGKLIGVVRLAHDRTDELIHDTGRLIGESFDYCIVFDKIDGHLRQPKIVRSNRFPEIIGRTSELLAAGAKETNDHVERILREDEAIARAAELAGPHDVVVDIVNDDIEQSIAFIRDSFNAKLM